MRNQKKVDLKDYAATVKEIRIGDVRSFLTSLKEAEIFKNGAFDKTTLIELLTEHYDAIDPLMDGCLEFSDPAKTPDDIALSEALKIAEAFMEVNPVFLSFVAQAQKGLAPKASATDESAT
jgi:hypothetical protein